MSHLRDVIYERPIRSPCYLIVRLEMEMLSGKLTGVGVRLDIGEAVANVDLARFIFVIPGLASNNLAVFA